MVPVGLSCSTDDLPSLSVSPILSDSQGVSVAGVSPASPMMSDSPSLTTGVRDVLLESPPFDPSRPTPTSSAVASSGVPDCLSSWDLHGSPGPVPRWRLARDGPFLYERTPSALNSFGDGCSFVHTTYRSSDYTVHKLVHQIFTKWPPAAILILPIFSNIDRVLRL